MFKWRSAIPEVPQPPTADQIKEDLANAQSDDIIFNISKDSTANDSDTKMYNKVKLQATTTENIKSEVAKLKKEQDVIMSNSDCVQTLITQLKHENK